MPILGHKIMLRPWHTHAPMAKQCYYDTSKAEVPYHSPCLHFGLASTTSSTLVFLPFHEAVRPEAGLLPLHIAPRGTYDALD